MASLRCTVKVAHAQRAATSSRVHAIADGRYSRNGRVVCPLSGLVITATGESVDHSHIVPKNLSHHYPRGLLDSADNIIPTFPALHRQMELHQHRPSLSFEFVREDNESFDLYRLLFAATLDAGHVIFRYITHHDPVLLHRSSRVFLSIHRDVFADCEANSGADTSSLMQLRDSLAQMHLRAAITKGIVHAMIGRRGRTLKEGKKTNKATSQAQIRAWLDSERIVVSGAMWTYGEDEEVPEQVGCRVLFHNPRQKTIELICVDDYSPHDLDCFMRSYNPKSASVPKFLSGFTVWKMRSCDLEEFVLEVVSKPLTTGLTVHAGQSSRAPDLQVPLGSTVFNFLEQAGFCEYSIVEYGSTTGLVRVAATEDPSLCCELSCSQLDSFLRGEVDAQFLPKIIGRFFIVRPTDSRPSVAQILSVSAGEAEVHWVETNTEGSKSRPQSCVDMQFWPVFEGPRGQRTAGEVRKRRGWHPAVSRIPLMFLEGMPFDLHNGFLPFSASAAFAECEQQRKAECVPRSGTRQPPAAWTCDEPGPEPDMSDGNNSRRAEFGGAAAGPNKRARPAIRVPISFDGASSEIFPPPPSTPHPPTLSTFIPEGLCEDGQGAAGIGSIHRSRTPLFPQREEEYHLPCTPPLPGLDEVQEDGQHEEGIGSMHRSRTPLLDQREEEYHLPCTPPLLGLDTSSI
jgi:hypothetical protein